MKIHRSLTGASHGAPRPPLVGRTLSPLAERAVRPPLVIRCVVGPRALRASTGVVWLCLPAGPGSRLNGAVRP